jgi:hypothetical protein
MDGEGKLMHQNPDPFSVRLPFNYPDGTAGYMKPFKSETEVAEMLHSIYKVSPERLTSKVNPAITAAAHQFYPSYPAKFRSGTTAQNVRARIGQGLEDMPPITLGRLTKFALKYGEQRTTGTELFGKPDENYTFLTDTVMPFVGMPVYSLTKSEMNVQANKALAAGDTAEGINWYLRAGHSPDSVYNMLIKNAQK